MLHVLTPQFASAGEFRTRDELNAFLNASKLVSVKAGAQTLVYSKQLAEKIYTLLKHPATRVIRGSRDHVGDLRGRFIQALEAGVTVVYKPHAKAMRHFYSAAGFCQSMDKLAAEIPSVDIAIPAGIYRQQLYLFGLVRTGSS